MKNIKDAQDGKIAVNLQNVVEMVPDISPSLESYLNA
jgi:hypothetical protein